ncbi:TFIID-31kDa-domain-containing protein [Lepidopterella palustris CBS 459.81]|uniref:TFIID-31kDa-domain-containing protein n=1 Tax=Lepidopterella palustris CBS 459.81 TaxID=1314670 RepID=A0A8E2JHA0_9PEZI|nr:TFIID-31kDa-domain-containing protein [Lepidopterella palustris CBS 459.81]
MASPTPGDLPNGISTPPTTNNSTNPPNPSPPNSTQPASQSQQNQASQSSNGQSTQTILPSHPPTSLTDPGTSKRPRDARLLHLVLANMGVHSYSERVPLQLLDFAYRYTSSVLSDAISYGDAPTAPISKKGGTGGDDGGVSIAALRTAVASRAGFQFNPALPKEFLAEVAGERNRIALPRVEREYGVRLPPERYCFTGVGWGIKDAWESEGEEETDEGGKAGAGLGAGADTVMGEGDEDDNEGEFEEVMGVGSREVEMVDG